MRHAVLAGRDADLDALLPQADIVSIHAPLTAETRHLIDARRLALMRPTAVLINTARGPVVDEAALAEALRDGTIAGAGLDVYEHEPEVTEALLGLENVVLAPHLGSATRDTRSRDGDALRQRAPRRAARGPHAGQRRGGRSCDDHRKSALLLVRLPPCTTTTISRVDSPTSSSASAPTCSRASSSA